MALDYQTDYVEVRTKEEIRSRKATQTDFDNF
ncbi:putative phage-related protein [Streptococcus anginosus C238]|nr:putative phage-related protein [Streptococcus anginosus C238]